MSALRALVKKSKEIIFYKKLFNYYIDITLTPLINIFGSVTERWWSCYSIWCILSIWMNEYHSIFVKENIIESQSCTCEGYSI